MKFFTNLYKESYYERPKLDGLAFKRISEEQTIWMEPDFDKTEGFSMKVYERGWHFMKPEIMSIVMELQSNWFLNWCVNSTFLIPKKEGEKRDGDFHPISLLHSVYKIISKTLVIWLGTVMETLIYEFYSTLVKGRLIQDSIVIVNKLVDSRIRGKKPGLLFKLNFYKAFDCISWRYLDYVWMRYEFNMRWRTWIQTCLFTWHFAIFLNGSRKGQF